MIDTALDTPRPTDNAAVWLPTLDGILREQDASTSELEALSVAQRGHVERSETDDLLRVLGRRQTLLEAALASAKRLEPFLARWDEFMDALPQPERGALVERVRAIQQRVDRIATADEDDRRRLTAQRNDLTAELAGVGRSRGALAAYASPGSRSPNPRFQDRKG